MGYAVRITAHAVDVVTGADKTPGIVAAEASGAASRKKWGGGELRSRAGRQSSGWSGEGGSPYGSYAGTPVSGGGFSNPSSPYLSSSFIGNGAASPGAPRSSYGLGLTSPSFGPASSPRLPPQSAPPHIPTAATIGSPYSAQSPYTPSSPPTTAGLYAHFPPTPNPSEGPNGPGFPHSPGPGASMFSAQQGTAPPRRENGMRHTSNGSLGATKKDD